MLAFPLLPILPPKEEKKKKRRQKIQGTLRLARTKRDWTLNVHMTYVRKILATIKVFTETTWLSLGISENQWPNPQRTEHAAPFFPFPYVSRSRSQWLPARSHLYLTLKNHLDSSLKLQPLEPCSCRFWFSKSSVGSGDPGLPEAHQGIQMPTERNHTWTMPPTATGEGAM